MTTGARLLCERRERDDPGRDRDWPPRDDRAEDVPGELNCVFLPCAERDDAALRIVGRNANRDPIAGHNLDAKPPHPAAQLGEHFVAGVYLHAVKTTAMHSDNRALHVY